MDPTTPLLRIEVITPGNPGNVETNLLIKNLQTPGRNSDYRIGRLIKKLDLFTNYLRI